MDYGKGEWVVHCTHGLGQVLGIEERTMNNAQAMYYVVKAADLTIWVPMDQNIHSRLRSPSKPAQFRQILATLTEPAETLPDDYRVRNQQLQIRLKEGSAESWCKLLRDLTAYRHGRSWSDHDQALIKSVRKILLAEWSFSLSITAEQADIDLRRLLTPALN